MRSADGDAALIPPPILGTAWGGVQLALTMVAGGRRRFRGQPLIAGALAAGATALGATALGLFRRSGTTFHPQHPDEATALVTDGVYAYTRNPMYCAILLVLLAHAIWEARLRTLVALPGLLLTLQPQIAAEEDALTRLFGADYEEYRARVPRWL